MERSRVHALAPGRVALGRLPGKPSRWPCRLGVRLTDSLQTQQTSVSTTITRLFGRAPQGERLVQRCCTGTEDADVHRCAAAQPRYRALCVRRRNERRYIQGLRRAIPRSDFEERRHRVHGQCERSKVDGIEEAIEARGAIPFYLPAYSPDLNPIEQFFPSSKRCCVRSLRIRSKTPPSPSTACARQSPLVLATSPGLNVPHTSPIQDMVNLAGNALVLALST